MMTIIEAVEPAKLEIFLEHWPFELDEPTLETFAKLDAECREFAEAMSRNSRDTVKQNHRAELAKAVAEGSPDAVRRLEKSREDLETLQLEAERIRTAIRGGREVWARERLCPAVVRPLELLASHIAEDIEILEGVEQSAAEKFGVKFVPSQTIKAAREMLARVNVDLGQARSGKLQAQSPFTLFAFSTLK